MSIHSFSDEELITSFRETMIHEQEVIVHHLELLAEMDRRKLFFHHTSLWAYVVHEYQMEESTAERRIRTARLLMRFPFLKEKLESGQLNLSLLEIAQGCAAREKISDADLAEILEAISGMSCRAARREVAFRYPDSVEIPKDQIRVLTPKLSEVRFVANDELIEKLGEIRGLLAHSHPGITMGELIDVLATEYRRRHHPEERAARAEEREAKRKQLEAEAIRSGVIGSPSTSKVVTPESPFSSIMEKRIPSRLQFHALIKAEGYLCSNIDPVTKIRCNSRYGLEVDHVRAWSLAGKTELKNLRFLCPNHHRRISFLQFGAHSQYSSPRGT